MHFFLSWYTGNSKGIAYEEKKKRGEKEGEKEGRKREERRHPFDAISMYTKNQSFLKSPNLPCLRTAHNMATAYYNRQ